MARVRHPYWLFGGRDDRAKGGIDDLLATFANLDAALAYLAEQEQGSRANGDWYQLVDVTTAYAVRSRYYLAREGWFDYREETRR